MTRSKTLISRIAKLSLQLSQAHTELNSRKLSRTGATYVVGREYAFEDKWGSMNIGVLVEGERTLPGIEEKLVTLVLNRSDARRCLVSPRNLIPLF